MKARRRLQVIAVGLVIAALPALWALTPIHGWLVTALQEVRALGAVGVLLYLVLFLATGALLVPAGILMAAAGLLYGWGWGALLAWVASVLCAAQNALLGRTLLRRAVVARLRAEGGALLALEQRIESRGTLVVALLRVSPLSPFHPVSFALGATRVHLWQVALGTAIGALPPVALYTSVGASLGGLDALANGLQVDLGPAWVVLVPTILGTGALTWVARRELRRLAAGVVDGGTSPHEAIPAPEPPGGRMSFDTLIADANTTIGQIAAFLDGLDHAGRMAALANTTKVQQRKLWELAAAGPAITLEHFVPAGVPDLTEVIHHGRNTLPVFRSFQKRFARPNDGTPRAIGYNEGSTRALIGPGYFVTHDTVGNADWEARGAWVVDYFQVPEGVVPAGWPTVVPNSRGPQILVYHRTRDFMRKVSEHVSIGMAFKVEKSLNNWFTLIREDRT